MSTHTPGPWVIRRERDSERPSGWMLPNYWHVDSAGGRWIADFPRLIDEAREQQVADIHLVAAAPELLEALREALQSLEYVERMHGNQITGGFKRWDDIKRARAAIAKATQPARDATA